MLLPPPPQNLGAIDFTVNKSHSSTSSVIDLPAGVRQIRNAAPPPRDSFFASSFVSVQPKQSCVNKSVTSARASVTRSLNRGRSQYQAPHQTSATPHAQSGKHVYFVFIL